MQEKDARTFVSVRRFAAERLWCDNNIWCYIVALLNRQVCGQHAFQDAIPWTPSDQVLFLDFNFNQPFQRALLKANTLRSLRSPWSEARLHGGFFVLFRRCRSRQSREPQYSAWQKKVKSLHLKSQSIWKVSGRCLEPVLYGQKGLALFQSTCLATFKHASLPQNKLHWPRSKRTRRGAATLFSQRHALARQLRLTRNRAMQRRRAHGAWDFKRLTLLEGWKVIPFASALRFLHAPRPQTR